MVYSDIKIKQTEQNEAIADARTKLIIIKIIKKIMKLKKEKNNDK